MEPRCAMHPPQTHTLPGTLSLPAASIPAPQPSSTTLLVTKCPVGTPLCPALWPSFPQPVAFLSCSELGHIPGSPSRPLSTGQFPPAPFQLCTAHSASQAGVFFDPPLKLTLHFLPTYCPVHQHSLAAIFLASIRVGWPCHPNGCPGGLEDGRSP